MHFHTSRGSTEVRLTPCKLPECFLDLFPLAAVGMPREGAQLGVGRQMKPMLSNCPTSLGLNSQLLKTLGQAHSAALPAQDPKSLYQ